MHEQTKAFKAPEIHPNVIVCGLTSEQKLKNAVQFLKDNNIKIIEYYEPDMDNQLTSIATEPLYGDIRLKLKKFQLLR